MSNKMNEVKELLENTNLSNEEWKEKAIEGITFLLDDLSHKEEKISQLEGYLGNIQEAAEKLKRAASK